MFQYHFTSLKNDNIKVYSKQYTWDIANQQLVHSVESDNDNVFKSQDPGYWYDSYNVTDVISF